MANLSLFEYFVNIIVFAKNDDLAIVTFAKLKRYLPQTHTQLERIHQRRSLGLRYISSVLRVEIMC